MPEQMYDDLITIRKLKELVENNILYEDYNKAISRAVEVFEDAVRPVEYTCKFQINDGICGTTLQCENQIRKIGTEHFECKYALQRKIWKDLGYLHGNKPIV